MLWLLGLFFAICYHLASVKPLVTISGHPIPGHLMGPNGEPAIFDEYGDMPSLERVIQARG
jgi:hypothetical protein